MRAAGGDLLQVSQVAFRHMVAVEDGGDESSRVCSALWVLWVRLG